MTYLNTTSLQSPSLSAANPTQIHAAYIAAISPKVIALITALLMWIGSAQSRQRSSQFVKGAKVTAAMSALAMILVVLPGTLAQKKALLKSLFAKTEARMDKLYAAYLIWRQRKCWMWGGGLWAASLSRLPDVFTATGDLMSFDALIPD